MTKRLLLFVLILLKTAALAYVPEVQVSPRPVMRPPNVVPNTPKADGEFHSGILRLSFAFYDEGVFYQRNQREQLIPILYYLKNEYPNVDFNTIRLTKLNFNTRTLGDYAFIRFYSQQGLMLKETLIPKLEDPSEVFGDFINASIDDREIDNFLYVGVSGIQNINNVTATFIKGRPNFSMDTASMPSEGGYVGELEGYQAASFDEGVFAKIMREVRKMSEVNSPSFDWQRNDRNNDPYDYGNDQPVIYNNDNEPYPTYDSRNYYNPTPNVVPYRERSQREITYNTQVNHVIDRVGLFGGTLILTTNYGEGQLTGYQIQRRNARVKYTQLETSVGPYKPVRITLRKGDTDGIITFFFSSITKNATTFIMRER